MKTRLLGAAVIIALAVLFIPMFFSSTPPAAVGDSSVSLAIPDSPDRELQTKTMSLNGASETAPATAATTASNTTVSSDRLATVNIGSNRPRDVEIDPEAGKPRNPTTVTIGSGTSPEQPVIPMRNSAAASTPPAPATPKAAPVAKAPVAAPVQKTTPPKPAPVAAPTKPAAVAAAVPAAPAGHGNYTLNLSAYASAAGAAKLQGQVRALGYPVHGHAVKQAGQQRTLVIAGPFDTRTAAEAARLKITQSIAGVPARLEENASHASASPATRPAAAPTATTATSAKAKAGGWAVQLAAMSSQADANALRDKLRAGGFDGYVDSVQSNGKGLWRVRAGPQAQRADAVRIHDQIKAKLGINGNVVSVP
ncbi:MAG: SPOR domain-containing protein [Rhodanobacter sp.]